ncbi:MAG: replication-associated recombination protein A [Planctomycetota bacterium]
MSDLWQAQRDRARLTARSLVAPLAVRMRPTSIDEVEGQRHILGTDDDGRPRLLPAMIKADTLTSILLHGPPGTGKTTLAEVVAGATGRVFLRENAASVGVKRIREIIDDAETRLVDGNRRTILFLDEIHRFSKSQQDVLLGDVERGVITLIGATTENPLFAVNSALVSRSTLFRLEPLTEADIARVVQRAVHEPDRGYGKRDVTVTDDALHVWGLRSEGDARRALTALEVAVESMPRDAGPVIIDGPAAEASIQQKVAVYGDDGHYDHASAMIKSVRGGDPDAALYWMARMLDAGEDPRFIARRLAILASEDIGNADPHAISVADAAWSLAERIGMPEARITLSQCATYLALAPKSNASYLAIDAALKDVREERVMPVPMFLRDPNSSATPARTDGSAKNLREHRAAGHDRYQYAHDSNHDSGGTGVTSQDYLGVDRRYYEPTDRGEERDLRQRLEAIRQAREALRDAGH